MIKIIEETRKRLSQIRYYAIVFTEQNIDVSKLLFNDCPESKFLRYQEEDKLCLNHTKLLSFFNINKIISKHKNDLSTEDISFTNTGLIKAIIKVISKSIHSIKYYKYNKIRKNYSAYAFNNEELNILTQILNSYNKYDLREVIIDNLDCAPSTDLAFFKKMIESNFLASFAPDLKIIFLTNKVEINGVNLKKIINDNIININLNNNEIDELLLTRYGSTKININKLRHYFILCGKNLRLMDTIINSNITRSLNFDTLNEFVNIVKTILKEIGQVTALEFAAIIGLSFDLACVSNAMELNLDEIIFQFEQANVKGLIVKKENDYDYEFVDELIRKIICDSGANKSCRHSQYAKYLNKTSPKNYLLIAHHYYNAFDIESAILQYFCYVLDSYTENRQTDDKLEIVNKLKNKIVASPIINAYYLEMLELLELYKSNEFIPQVLSADDNPYARFINYVKLVLEYLGHVVNTKQEFIELANNLEESYMFLDQQSLNYQKVQCLLYLIDIYSYRIGDQKMLKNKITFIQNIYKNYIMDNADINMQMKIERKLASIKNAEVAFAKTKYFYKAINQNAQNTQNLDAVEYFKFLSDHLGFALYSGNYDNLEPGFIEEFKSHLDIAVKLEYPKTYKAQINYLLFHIFNEKITRNELTNIINYIDEGNHGRMYVFDIASIYIIIGRLHRAEAILLNLLDQAKENLTCFYDYCFSANLASLYLLKGNYNLAKRYNDRVLLHDYDWDTEFIEIMKYRSTLLNQFIQQKKKFTSKSLFNCFNNIDIHLSSVWKFLGKGIIFSELMYYRE